jgi:hypothetical protein
VVYPLQIQKIKNLGGIVREVIPNHFFHDREAVGNENQIVSILNTALILLRVSAH